jgi:hypothetical protein
MLFQNRPDLLGLDKLIESSAPASPRRIENEKDSFVLLGGFGLGLGQHLFGRGGSLIS